MRKYFILLIIIGVVALSLWYFFIYEKQSSVEDWVLYKNENQGFEIKIPHNWPVYIYADHVSKSLAEGGRSEFNARFGTSRLGLYLSKNEFTETTSYLPSSPACFANGTTTFSNMYNISTGIVSTSGIKDDGSKCGEAMGSEHSIYSRICVSDNGEIYPARIEQGYEEFSFVCNKPDDNLYDINLHCEGTEWAGTNGQKACSQLFDKFISTFKISK